MVISASLAVYPMGQRDFRAVDAAIEALRAPGLEVSVGPMHTMVTGELREVFEAMARAFEAAAEHGGVVMTVTASNACPV